MSLLLIEQHDPTPVFRTTLWTQSLYWIACVLVLMFVQTNFKSSMMKYVFWGAWLLVIYGFTEWGIYTLTGHSIDLLSNRTFSQAGGDSRSGSWLQTISLGPFRMMRMKSTMEEPSRFAMAAVVYLCLAIGHRRHWLSLALLLGLFLSVSTTGLLCVFVMFAVFLIYGRGQLSRGFVIGMFGVASFGVLLAIVGFPEAFDEIVLSRLRGDHLSAVRRTSKLSGPLPVFASLPFLNQLFGVGIGTCYLPGALRLLINCGVLGLAIAVTAFVYPFLRLAKSNQHVGLMAALAVLLFAYTFVVSAIFIPLTWMVIGIAFATIAEANSRDKAIPVQSSSYSLGTAT